MEEILVSLSIGFWTEIFKWWLDVGIITFYDEKCLEFN